MNIGEYCRNKYGIAKVIDIENNNGIDVLVFDKPICFLVDKKTGEIKEDKLLNKLAIIDDIDLSKIKHSPNIIDLIEVGDYVNGFKVIGVNTDIPNVINQYVNVDTKFGEKTSYLQSDIKSIITHEQIESMEYKVKE